MGLATMALLAGCVDNSDSTDTRRTDTDTGTAEDTNLIPIPTDDDGSESGTTSGTIPDGETTSDTDTGPVDIGAQWATIPAGSFWMGTPGESCPADYPGGASCTLELGRFNDEALHYVTLTRDIELMRTELTQAQFVALMGWNPSYFGPRGAGTDCGDSCPVETVSWNDAAAYANELSRNDGLTPCYVLTNVTCAAGTSPVVGTDYMSCFDGDAASNGGIAEAFVALNGVATPQACAGYRLPTESEWEYAARAQTLTAFYNGEIIDTISDPNLDLIGWYDDNAGGTPHPVAGKAANAWGLYDMSGNVSEWTWDGYQTEYPAGTPAAPVVDPTGPASQDSRVLRGGYWGSEAEGARSGFRDFYTPLTRDYDVGFRLARSVP